MQTIKATQTVLIDKAVITVKGMVPIDARDIRATIKIDVPLLDADQETEEWQEVYDWLSDHRDIDAVAIPVRRLGEYDRFCKAIGGCEYQRAAQYMLNAIGARDPSDQILALSISRPGDYTLLSPDTPVIVTVRTAIYPHELPEDK